MIYHAYASCLGMMIIPLYRINRWIDYEFVCATRDKNCRSEVVEELPQQRLRRCSNAASSIIGGASSTDNLSN